MAPPEGVKTTALGQAALKTDSTCSLATANCAVSPVLALPNLRSLRFHTFWFGAYCLAQHLEEDGFNE
jgi:hypothetical protein